MIEVNVPFPDVETECPSCGADVFVSGYEFIQWSDGSSRCVTGCDACDQQFRVIVGGD